MIGRPWFTIRQAYAVMRVADPGGDRPLMLLEVFRPERYHGHRRRPPFFEGWWFKLVDPTGHHFAGQHMWEGEAAVDHGG